MAQWSAVTANARELALPLLKPPLVDLGSNRVLKTQNRLFVLISLHSKCNLTAPLAGDDHAYISTEPTLLPTKINHLPLTKRINMPFMSQRSTPSTRLGLAGSAREAGLLVPGVVARGLMLAVPAAHETF